MRQTITKALLYAAPLLTALCWGTAFAEAPAAKSAAKQTDVPAASALPLDELRVFTRAFELIRANYVEDVGDKVMLENAVRGMLSELDPHSDFLDANEFQDLQETTSGEFAGVGIEVNMEHGLVRIITPMDDSPAQKAGILAGDMIVKIDGQLVQGLSLGDATKLMRGKQGSKVTLIVLREGMEKPLQFNLVRDVVKVNSVRAHWIEPGYAYLRIAQFQVNTSDEMFEALRNLTQDAAHKDKSKKEKKAGDSDVSLQDIKGLVLDLRNNPGGVLQSAVQVVDAFTNDGLIVYTKGRQPESRVDFRASPGDVLQGAPIVVLINGGSASASEIVAGALQDQHRALILGTQSFGKGSVQTVIPLTPERAIKLTTALYYTPNGRSIQAQGIVPDVVVEFKKTSAKEDGETIAPTEASLNRHLGNANSVDAQHTAVDEGKQALSNGRQLLADDNQLFEAFNALKAVALLSGNHQ